MVLFLKIEKFKDFKSDDHFGVDPNDYCFNPRTITISSFDYKEIPINEFRFWSCPGFLESENEFKSCFFFKRHFYDSQLIENCINVKKEIECKRLRGKISLLNFGQNDLNDL